MKKSEIASIIQHALWLVAMCILVSILVHNSYQIRRMESYIECQKAGLECDSIWNEIKKHR